MTPEAMNRAIAEHKGLPLTVERWKFTHDGVERDGFPSLNDATFHMQGMCRVYGGTASKQPVSYMADALIPNYSGDLNAMHEAINRLPLEMMGVMAMNLSRVVGDQGINTTGEWLPHSAYVWNAKAQQLAEAFLLTVSKWKEAE